MKNRRMLGQAGAAAAWLAILTGCAAYTGPRATSTAYPPENTPRPTPPPPLRYEHTVAAQDEWYLLPSKAAPATSVEPLPAPGPAPVSGATANQSGATSAVRPATATPAGPAPTGNDKLDFVRTAYAKRGNPRVAVVFFDVAQTILLNPTLRPIWQRERDVTLSGRDSGTTGKPAESSAAMHEVETVSAAVGTGAAAAPSGRSVRVKGFASTDAKDRHGDSINPRVFDIETFMRNPQLWLNHELYTRPGTNTQVPVGTVESARVARVSGSGGQIQIIDTQTGSVLETLRSGRTKDFLLRDGETGLWVSALVLEPEIVGLVMDGRLNAFSWRGRLTRLRDGRMGMDLIEISLVNVPANPEALFTVEGGGAQTGRSGGPADAPAQLITWSDVQQSVFEVLRNCGFKMTDPEMITLTKLDRLLARSGQGVSLHTAELESLRSSVGYEVLFLVQELREGDTIYLQGRTWDLRDGALLGAYRIPLLVSKESMMGQLLARKRARQLAGELVLLAAQSWSTAQQGFSGSSYSSGRVHAFPG